MICRDFPSLISAHLDGYATESEQVELQAHLGQCLTCRRRATEWRNLRAELRALETPRPPVEMTAGIQAALQREARVQARATLRRADLIDLWRMRIFAQSIGAVVSLVLFIFLASAVLRPAYRGVVLARAALMFELGNEPLDVAVPPEIRLKVLLLQPPPPPSFSPSLELLGIGQVLPAGTEFISTVKVGKDGRAQLGEFVGTPDDPTLMARFSDALFQRASFQPTRRDQFISSDAVLMFITVNVPD